MVKDQYIFQLHAGKCKREEHTGTASTPRGFLLPHAGSPVTFGLFAGLFRLGGGFGLVVSAGLKVVPLGVVVTGESGAASQSPKICSSSVQAAGSPMQQPVPKISQSDSFGSQDGSVGRMFVSQHPVPKMAQSESSTQGGAVVTGAGISSQHLSPKSSQSGR